ncbi:unnamed protein product [Rotaria socialis]|uniref:Uncharacterized protein n=1 Tax=Rotaria socialis TaxID=392032 RepID=A0A821GC51_9BILA|nr:unnamed protein product [Rotaria socialis]
MPEFNVIFILFQILEISVVEAWKAVNYIGRAQHIVEGQASLSDERYLFGRTIDSTTVSIRFEIKLCLVLFEVIEQLVQQRYDQKVGSTTSKYSIVHMVIFYFIYMSSSNSWLRNKISRAIHRTVSIS